MNYKKIADKQKELMKIKDRIYTIKLQLEGYTEVQSYSQSYRRLSNEEDNLHEKEIKIESELSALESEKDVTAEEILKKHKNWEVGISDADCIQAMEQYSQSRQVPETTGKSAENTTAKQFIIDTFGENWLHFDWQAGDVMDAMDDFSDLKLRFASQSVPVITDDVLKAVDDEPELPEDMQGKRLSDLKKRYKKFKN